jgi:hypothetical protein
LAPTLQIMVARRLAGIADAIRGGEMGRADQMAARLKAALPAVSASGTTAVRPSQAAEQQEEPAGHVSQR